MRGALNPVAALVAGSERNGVLHRQCGESAGAMPTRSGAPVFRTRREFKRRLSGRSYSEFVAAVHPLGSVNAMGPALRTAVPGPNRMNH